MATRTNAPHRLASLLLLSAVLWWAGSGLARAGNGTGRGADSPGSAPSTTASTTASTTTTTVGNVGGHGRPGGNGDHPGRTGPPTTPPTTTPVTTPSTAATGPGHGPATSPGPADPSSPAQLAVFPADPVAFLDPLATFASPVAGSSGPLAGPSASAERTPGYRGSVPNEGSIHHNAPGTRAGPSGDGFLGSSLHSGRAATRLYLPVGLLAVTAGVLLVQAHLAKRDPKLSRAPTRPDDDAVGFHE